MTNASTTLAAQYSILNDLSTRQNTENIVYREPPPPYEFAVNNHASPATVQYQSQWGAIGNVGYIANMYDGPSTINSQIPEAESYKIRSIFSVICCFLIFVIVVWYYLETY